MEKEAGCGYLIKGIMVAHDAANVPKHFENTPADHGNSEADEALGKVDLD